MSAEAKVAEHYGAADLTERILSALNESGLDVDKLTADALFPFDQMHGRQLTATREHVARLELDASKHVLDVGSGVGGPARYMAFTSGCRVTGIDLTESFVEAARELTRRCGLADRVAFRAGSALEMPFDDGMFDAAACQYVAMNIADKHALLRQIFRVLKPGGRLMYSSVVAGKGRTGLSASVGLRTGRQLPDPAGRAQSAVRRGGWRIVEWSDESGLLRSAQSAPQPAVNQAMRTLISGDDFPLRSKNFSRNIEAGSLGSMLVVAERP